MKFKFIKYAVIALLLCKCLTQISYAYNLPLFNDTLNKKGFIKKQPFNIGLGYEYSSTDGFNLITSSTINSAAISKSSNGIKTEAGLYITPFLKIFINYTFRNSLLNIEYTINKEDNKDLVKDYTAVFSRKSNEHIYMACFEAAYEWTIKKYTPYISFKAGFGGTTADCYLQVQITLLFLTVD